MFSVFVVNTLVSILCTLDVYLVFILIHIDVCLYIVNDTSITVVYILMFIVSTAYVI